MMKKNMKGTARLAVYAGLCASLTLVGAPVAAIADEPVVVPVEETQAGALSTESEVVPTAGEVYFPNGKGTVEEPWQIGTVKELQLLAKYVNEGEAAVSSAHFVQTANIDLSGVAWEPIGTDKDCSFNGSYDGKGFTISNLAVSEPNAKNVGLFGHVSLNAYDDNSGVIKNVTVNGANVSGRSNVGVIAGTAYTGALTNCKVTGTINVAGNYMVGGLAGSGYAGLTDCSVAAAPGSTVTATYFASDLEGDCVGGLVGFRGEGGGIETIGCSVSGVSVSGTRKVGGLIGSAFTDNKVQGCSVSNVSVTCNATAEYANSKKNSMGIGGLIGLFSVYKQSNGTVSDCSVSNITLGSTYTDVDKIVVKGYMSGGQRGSGDSPIAPDDAITIDNNLVSGSNSGSNAEEKFPGNTDINGVQAVANVLNADGSSAGAFGSLAEAVAAAKDGQTVQLAKDVELAELVRINTSIKLDLGGKTIAIKHNSFGIAALNNSEVEIFNGTITSEATKGVGAVLAQSASVTVSDLHLVTKTYALQAGSPNGAGSITVNEGTVIDSEGIAVVVLGTYDTNDEVPEGAVRSKLVVNDAVINAVSTAISGNGSAHATETVVNGGAIFSKNGPAIYHPQLGVLKLNGGKLTGVTGIEIRSGELNISGDPVITATGEFLTSQNGNGSTTDGAGIVIAQHTTKHDIKVTIEGNPTISGEYAFIEHNPQGNDPSPSLQTQVAIKGGNFKGKVASEGLEGFITGGTFDTAPAEDLIAEGAVLNKNEDGSYGVHVHKMELVKQVDPTCGKPGVKAHYVCSECDGMFSDELGEKPVTEEELAIPATGEHEFSDGWTAGPDSHWHACEACGAKSGEAGHEGGEWVANKTDHWRTCEVCGGAYAIGAHEFGDWKVTKEPTATEPGERERVCGVCGKSVSEEIPALGEKPAGKPDGKPEGDKLAQTGDDSMLPIAIAGGVGVAAVAAGVVVAVKRRK